MAASSFIGTFVEVQLSHGADLFGFITAVDPVAQTLSFRDPHTGHISTLSKGDIVNLQIKEAPLLDHPLTKDEADKLQAQADFHPAARELSQPPTKPAAAAVDHTIVRPHDEKQVQLKQQPKEKRKQKDKGAHIRSETPTRAAQHGQQQQQRQPNKSERSQEAQHSTCAAAYMKEFDFQANLDQFDKKKIWEEIRNSDKTDPSLLLVSHNRASIPVQLVRGPNGIGPVPIGGHRNGDNVSDSARVSRRQVGGAGVGDGGGARRRNGQEKLGNYEPVLSPSPPPVEERRADADAATSGTNYAFPPMDGHVAGKISARVDSETLRAELRELHFKLTLLQTLSGITIHEQGSSGTRSSNGSDHHQQEQAHRKYQCTVWKDHKAQAEARESGGLEGCLCFSVAATMQHQQKTKRTVASPLSAHTMSTDASSASAASQAQHVAVAIGGFRYLGPIAARSDATIIENMPAKYKQELSLRNETASIFFRRLRQAAFGEAG
ncbi:hypothetical protein K437DRAFT_296496 [Tilletiaria anomala UBC 951]|uniref:DFDF domain-containing protein n=1 Tax=Tilletiaria anomala (strain ATCC 24038 / CBS 436.72 / UBC 951) TaxID=1037660 RepID=A0A066VG52_TILAU|nr:uncharacterized protein K437DRAFT_296496 [Tilletiaria anomala UBC 951]KDN37739.1 hypothetical protein K437DRAFT_296496 [Tilletiaria anomala UBC 951]